MSPTRALRPQSRGQPLPRPRHPRTEIDASARFAVRARSRRRRRWASAVAAVLALGALAWLVFFSSVLAVDRIVVAGTDRVPRATIERVTDADLGRAMVLVDPRAIAARVRQVPLVRSVEVVRRWPSTLLVTVRERTPAAAVTVAGGAGVRLVDRDGVELAVVAVKPANVPLLDVNLEQAGAAALRAALDVLAGLPPDLSAHLEGIGADSPDGVWLTVSPGVRVVWGDASDNARKAADLRALIAAHRGARRTEYDVSAPDAPAVARRQ